MASLKRLVELNDKEINQLVASFVRGRVPSDSPICCFYSEYRSNRIYFKCDSEEDYEENFIKKCKNCQSAIIDRLKKGSYIA